MVLDFTVVFSVRQRFGDSNDEDALLETQAPFVGQKKDYEFWCPGVDNSQQAILLFQCQGSLIQQSLQINGQEIYGGIPSGSVGLITLPNNIIPNYATYAQWSGNIMLIQPGVLHENNVMHIQAQKILDDEVDNFIVDNVVVIFKARQGSGPIVSTDVAA